MIRSVFLIGSIVLMLSTQVTAESGSSVLRPFLAEYSIRKSGVTVGILSRSLTFENNRYRFTSSAKTTGIAALFASNETKETSVGRLTGMTIVPEQYDYVRSKGTKIKSNRVKFDLVNHTLEINRRGVNSTRAAAVGGLDKLSYQLQLMLDLESESKPLAYTIETATKSKTYTAEKSIVEEITTPMGVFSTIRIEQVSSSSKRTTFWCSEELQFLPVKVVITEDEDVTEILLGKVQNLD